jgi:hypothetical protein
MSNVSRFRVEGVGFRGNSVLDVEYFTVEGLGFGVWGLGFISHRLRPDIRAFQALVPHGFTVWGLGFISHRLRPDIRAFQALVPHGSMCMRLPVLFGPSKT